MSSAENQYRLEIDLKINENNSDSKTEWEDARNKITRTCLIQTFLADTVGTAIQFSTVSNKKEGLVLLLTFFFS